MIKKPVAQPQDKYVLRLPDGLRGRIKAYAERNGRSMNAEIVRILEREFPEPLSIDQRITDILNLINVLKSGSTTDERIDKLVNEIKETIIGIYSGRIGDVDDETRFHISVSFNEWRDKEAENASEDLAIEYDHEELISIERVGIPEKYAKPLRDDDEEPF